VITFLAAAAISFVNVCPWADRGLDRFMGDIPSAVDAYDIAKPTRDKLKDKMRRLAYDDITHLTAAGNSSREWAYGPPTMMHFGANGRVCRTVDTSMWAAGDPGERGLVYCADNECVVVWTVCRNVSRITRNARLTPPPSITPDPVAASVDPLPVDATVVIPPVEPGPVADLLPPQTFARLSDPELPEGRQELDTPEPERIRAEQTFYELWSRPIFGPVVRYFFVADAVTPPLVVDAPVASMPPVPGVVPPVIGDAIVIPSPGAPVFVLPNDPAKPLPGVDAPIAPVPELGTWALMLLGLAWIGIAVRRNGRK
jgi:hypothetical protein